MDFDRGAPDLGLASTLDEILGDTDPLGAWDADLRSQAPQKTPGDALWAGQTRRVSPDEQTNRALFPERVIDDDSEGEATRGPDPPLANLSQLQAWAADAARRLQAAAARSEADRLKILALEAASHPKKTDDEQAAWRLERATLETLAKARERAHAEKVKEMLADSLKSQSALEAAKDEVIESLTTELEETKRELHSEAQKGCELEAAVDARNARIDELKDEKAALQKANATLEAKLATRKQRDGTPTKARLDLGEDVNDEEENALEPYVGPPESPQQEEEQEDDLAGYLVAAPLTEDALAREDARHQRGADLELRARLKAAEAALRSLSDERRNENRAAARERDQLKEELARLATRHASEKVELGARVSAQERDEKNELRCALDLAAKDRDALRSDVADLKARCDASDAAASEAAEAAAEARTAATAAAAARDATDAQLAKAVAEHASMSAPPDAGIDDETAALRAAAATARANADAAAARADEFERRVAALQAEAAAARALAADRGRSLEAAKARARAAEADAAAARRAAAAAEARAEATSWSDATRGDAVTAAVSAAVARADASDAAVRELADEADALHTSVMTARDAEAAAAAAGAALADAAASAALVAARGERAAGASEGAAAEARDHAAVERAALHDAAAAAAVERASLGARLAAVEAASVEASLAATVARNRADAADAAAAAAVADLAVRRETEVLLDGEKLESATRCAEDVARQGRAAVEAALRERDEALTTAREEVSVARGEAAAARAAAAAAVADSAANSVAMPRTNEEASKARDAARRAELARLESARAYEAKLREAEERADAKLRKVERAHEVALKRIQGVFVQEGVAASKKATEALRGLAAERQFTDREAAARAAWGARVDALTFELAVRTKERAEALGLQRVAYESTMHVAVVDAVAEAVESCDAAKAAAVAVAEAEAEARKQAAAEELDAARAAFADELAAARAAAAAAGSLTRDTAAHVGAARAEAAAEVAAARKAAAAAGASRAEAESARAAADTARRERDDAAARLAAAADAHARADEAAARRLADAARAAADATGEKDRAHAGRLAGLRAAHATELARHDATHRDQLDQFRKLLEEEARRVGETDALPGPDVASARDAAAAYARKAWAATGDSNYVAATAEPYEVYVDRLAVLARAGSGALEAAAAVEDVAARLETASDDAAHLKQAAATIRTIVSPLQTPRARPRVAVVSSDHDAAAVWRKRCEEKDSELDALAREAEARLRRAADDVRRAEDAAAQAETKARRAAAAVERQDAAVRDGRVDALGAARVAVDEERRKAARDLRQRDAEHATALASLRERCANWLRQVKEEWSRAAKHALAKQRLRLAARHEALNAQAAKRWQRALDAALAGRATTCISPPPLRRRDETDALSDDEFEDPFPAGLESSAVPAY